MAEIENEELESLIRELCKLRSEMVQLADSTLRPDDTLDPAYRDSSRNLLHYVALRRHDLRLLQGRLAALGLSSLGRVESHVLGGIDAVLRILHRLAGRAWQQPQNQLVGLALASGDRLLANHAEALFGPVSRQLQTRIMVTMPSEAADDYLLVHDLLKFLITVPPTYDLW
jgi:pyruvate kinase